MNTKSNKWNRWWKVGLWIAVITGFLGCGFLGGRGVLRGQSGVLPGDEASRAVFTPGHASFGEALRHFLGIRDEPRQPIAYSHALHLDDVGLTCDFCHANAGVGPIAGIPSIETCMFCHLGIATDRPEIQLLTSYYDRFEEPPWQRVYGWPSEAHVRFNHAPHIRRDVECATCHGDLTQMTVAVRAVDHTMGFCVDCHNERQASNECLTCHY